MIFAQSKANLGLWGCRTILSKTSPFVLQESVGEAAQRGRRQALAAIRREGSEEHGYEELIDYGVLEQALAEVVLARRTRYVLRYVSQAFVAQVI